jgi:AraC-like DNA-binding protein
MPIDFFQRIIGNYRLSDEKIKLDKGYTALFILDSYSISAKDLNKNRLAFNDGIPTIAFFENGSSYIQVLQENTFYTIYSAWLTSQYLNNVYFNYLYDTDRLLIVRFNPLLFYQVFEISPVSLRKQPIWSLAASLGGHGDQLLKIVEAELSTSKKLNAIEDFMQKLNVIAVPNKILEEVLALVMLYKGQLSVNDITKKIKVNYKWLERNFKTYIGLSPKEYIRLQRFMHAYLRLIDSHHSTSLMEIAIKHGYYDTSHLQKDLKLFTGRTQL